MFCYFIIMLVAALGSYHYVFTPLITDAVSSGTRNTFTKDPNTSVIVLTFLAMLIAPITLVVLLVTPLRERVIEVLTVEFNRE